MYLDYMRGVEGSDYINASHIDVSASHYEISGLYITLPSPPAELPPPEGLHCHSRASKEHHGRLLAHGVEVQQPSHHHAY